MSHVQVVDYNPLWKEYFELEFIRIKEVLGSLCLEIHHVGSTAVPGLCAKPKIDIIAVFSTLSFEHTLLESHGYQYAGGFNIPLRKSFTRRVSRGALFDVNLHVFEKDDPEIELNLVFRDYLRKHDQDRDNYAQLKRDILQKPESQLKEGAFYRSYTLDKAEFILAILIRAGFNKPRFLIPTHRHEIEAYQEIYEKQFPNTCFDKSMLEKPRQYHFILILEKKILAIAHGEIINDQEALLYYLITTKEIENQGFDSWLLSSIERWLILQNKQTLLIPYQPTDVSFFITQGFHPKENSSVLEKKL